MAARKRTYLLRVCFALALFAISGAAYMDDVRWMRGPTNWSLLGTGGRLLEYMAAVQIGGIWVFLPAMVAPALTIEKERETLPLLFLTRIGPTRLLLEKLIGRLVPMIGLVLLSVPLLMVAYALGGISTTQVINTVWLLALTLLQAGCLSLACSAWCRTTVAAFIASYLVGVLFILGVPVLLAVLGELPLMRGRSLISEGLFELGLIPNAREGVFGLTNSLYLLLENGRGTAVTRMLQLSTPILTLSLCAFLAARFTVVSRAFLAPRNHLRDFFHWVDRLLTRWNDRFTGSVLLVEDAGDLPDAQPVAWHETTKKALGTFRYLLRVLLVLEIPVLVIAVIALAIEGNPFPEPVSAVQFLCWLLVILAITARASTLFAGERSRQTLDILLASPLTTKELLMQKYKAVHRLVLVLSVPLLTCVAFATYWRIEFHDQSWQRMRHYAYRNGPADHSPLCYIVCGLLAILIYPRLVAWFAIWVGMICRSPARAIMFAMIGIVTWCGLPALLVAWLDSEYPMRQYPIVGWMFLASPAAIVPINEFSEFGATMHPWLVTVLNFIFYGAALFFWRSVCVLNSAFWLKRPE